LEGEYLLATRQIARALSEEVGKMEEVEAAKCSEAWVAKALRSD